MAAKKETPPPSRRRLGGKDELEEESTEEVEAPSEEPTHPTSVGPGAPIKEQLAARARHEVARVALKKAHASTKEE